MPYTCVKCNRNDLSENEMHLTITSFNNCKLCYNKWHREYRAKNNSNKNRKNIKDMNLKCLYGITENNFNELRNLQLNGCAICKQSVELTVDHDHETNLVRGLLCRTCNLGLGAFKDNENLLLNAIEYLKRTTWNLRKAG